MQLWLYNREDGLCLQMTEKIKRTCNSKELSSDMTGESSDCHLHLRTATQHQKTILDHIAQRQSLTKMKGENFINTNAGA